MDYPESPNQRQRVRTFPQRACLRYYTTWLDESDISESREHRVMLQTLKLEQLRNIRTMPANIRAVPDLDMEVMQFSITCNHVE